MSESPMISFCPPQSVQFVVNLLQQVYKAEHNLVICPYNVTSALSLLLVGTAFVTENADGVRVTSDADQGKIKQLIKEISPSTRVNLMCVVRIRRGIWKSIFEKSDTKENGEFFKTSGQVVKTPLMKQSGPFLVFHDEKSKIKAVELEYKDGKASMVLILPGEGVSLESFIKSLTAQQLDHILNNLKHDWQISLIVPRFKMSLEHNLIPIMKSLKIEHAFDPFKAELSKISPQAQGLYLSEVIQKSVIDFNEIGTKTAAGTMVEPHTMGSFGYGYVDFIFNRPFLYVLVSTEGPKPVLFFGAVEDPSVEN